MKLSEAILLGSVGTGQAFHVFEDEGKTCAMGAALSAVGKLHAEVGEQWRNHDTIRAEWPWAKTKGETRHKCIVEGCDEDREHIANLVAHINNEHRWTRPQIAAWVASIEPADDPVPVPEQETVTATTTTTK